MPIKYILDNDNSLVLYEISGVVTPTDIESVSHEVMEKIEKDRSYNEFYLITDTTAYWAASKEYYERIRDDMVQRDKRYGYKRNKSALVTTDPYGRMVVPLWKEVTSENQEYGGETEVFETVETAVEWLGVELDNIENNIEKIKDIA